MLAALHPHLSNAQSQRIRSKFPGRVPIIVERVRFLLSATRARLSAVLARHAAARPSPHLQAAKSSDLPLIDKNKFLVPGDLTGRPRAQLLAPSRRGRRFPRC